MSFLYWVHHFWTLVQQSARVCPRSKTALLARHQHVLTFSHWADHFWAIFSKGHPFVQNSVFSPRSARNVIFVLCAPLLNSCSAKCTSLSKEQNSVISPTSARFNIFALGGPLLSDFQQRASVCPKQRFHQEISTFPHFRTGRTTFKWFLVSARVCRKHRFQAKISTFCHFRTGCNTF